jgi:hypothetical protein
VELFSENVLFHFHRIASYERDPYHPVDESGLLRDPAHQWHTYYVAVLSTAVNNRMARIEAMG